MQFEFPWSHGPWLYIFNFIGSPRLLFCVLISRNIAPLLFLPATATLLVVAWGEAAMPFPASFCNSSAACTSSFNRKHQEHIEVHDPKSSLVCIWPLISTNRYIKFPGHPQRQLTWLSPFNPWMVLSGVL